MANRFKQAAPKAKKLYRSGRYKTFAAAMKAALKKTPKKKRRVGATKFIERGETRSTPARRVIRRNRTRKGIFKSTTRITGVKTVRKQIEGRLGKAMLDHFKTQSIKRTKQLYKKISGLKKQLKSL